MSLPVGQGGPWPGAARQQGAPYFMSHPLSPVRAGTFVCCLPCRAKARRACGGSCCVPAWAVCVSAPAGVCHRRGMYAGAIFQGAGVATGSECGYGQGCVCVPTRCNAAGVGGGTGWCWPWPGMAGICRVYGLVGRAVRAPFCTHHLSGAPLTSGGRHVLQLVAVSARDRLGTVLAVDWD